MSELIILLGVRRAGKTNYAQKIEKDKEYEFIDFDQGYNSTGEEDFFKFIDSLADKLNQDKDKNFIMDGYTYFDKDINFKYLKKKLKFHEIRPIVIFENYEVIMSRGKGGAIRRHTKEEIINEYKIFQKRYSVEEFLRGSDYNRIETYGEVMRIVTGVTEQDVKDFLKKRKIEYPRNYHTIELPFGHKIQGYNANFEHKSWERIKDIIDYKGKSVADVGCFQGFFCFKIKEKGARNVVGLDNSGEAIDIGKEIAYLKGLDIWFECFNLETQEIPGEYDIILLMNISHHLKNPANAFRKVFSKAKSVITEVHFAQERPIWNIVSKEEIIEIAKEQDHKLIKEIDSARPNRKIMLFSNRKV